MSQPGRYLHLLESFAHPVTVREFDTWSEQDAPPPADVTSSRRALRQSLALGAWTAVTARPTARDRRR